MKAASSLLVLAGWLAASSLAASFDQVPLAPSDHLEEQGGGLHKIREALISAQIIPTVIDDFEPSLELKVVWKKKAVSLGNTLKVKKLKHEPHITLKVDSATTSNLCASNMTYVVTLSDPDAPSRDNPKWSEMCHYIASGVALSTNDAESCSEIQLSHLKAIMPYKPPGPPPKTGKHRYVFLAFAPANGTTESLHLSKPSDRQHWGTGEKGHGVRDWAVSNGLLPVAANFIYAENKKQ